MDDETETPHTTRNSDTTNKAHMLVAMLGQEFTNSTAHPFFDKLNAMVSQPDPSAKPVPKGALERLLAALPAAAGPDSSKLAPREATEASKPERSTGDMMERLSPSMRVLLDQHPAVIAHYLAHNAPAERMTVIGKLQGTTARQAAVYFTRFFNAGRKAG
ncbi:MAG: hypothetical protein AAGA12_10680 [Pseudomonadota bacterium]